MSEEGTSAAVQRYLDALAGDQPAEPIVRALLDRSVRRFSYCSCFTNGCSGGWSAADVPDVRGGAD